LSYTLNRFHNCRQLSNRNQRRTMIRGPGQVRASMAVLNGAEDISATAKFVGRKRHVCVRLCRSATPCTPARTGNFFEVDPPRRLQSRKDSINKKLDNQKFTIRKIFNSRNRQRSKLLRARLETFALQRAALFAVTIGGKAECSIFRCSPTHRHKDAQPERICSISTVPPMKRRHPSG
jgi:hypothetical protein